MLSISSYALAGQPIPNLFLAAVHQLLLKGKGHALASFYPSLAEHPRDKSQSFQHFKEFCLTHREEIIKILQTRLVQTNEVGRRSEEHTSELQSRGHLVCRLLLEKKN